MTLKFLILCLLPLLIESLYFRERNLGTEIFDTPIIYDCSVKNLCPINSSCQYFNSTNSYCDCNKGFITTDSPDNFCNYKQIPQLEAFLLSIFLGYLGVDWFVLSQGNGLYIMAGIFKLLTGGGFGIWYLVDWIRILCNVFLDGNGVPLSTW